MKVYKETVMKFVIILLVIQFFVGHWLPSTLELRWIILTFMLVVGLYFPSKKEVKKE